MKTKEETASPSLRSELWKSIFDIVRKMPIKDVDGDALDLPSCTTEIERIAQLYSDQQNKELREKLGRLNAELMDDDPAHTMDGVTTQAHFLKGYFTAKQLRDIADGIEPPATQRSAEDWKRMHNRVYQLAQNQESEIQRLTKEVERLNTCVKTYSDMSLRAQEQILEMEKQIGNWKVLSELNSKESIEKGLEIVRLRELLGEMKKAIVEDAIHWEPSAANKLLTNIDNASNHKS